MRSKNVFLPHTSGLKIQRVKIGKVACTRFETRTVILRLVLPDILVKCVHASRSSLGPQDKVDEFAYFFYIFDIMCQRKLTIIITSDIKKNV